MLGDSRVNYARGCNVNDLDKTQFNAAIKAAKKSEYVVFVAGLDNTVEGEGYFLFRDADEKGGGEVTRPDRASQTVLLPGVQNELINEIAKVNPNIILVVISGGTCSVTPVIKNIKGLLYAFYPGQEGGRAIADVLFGNYNPSGKMPVTMPKDDGQIIPISADFRNMVTKGVGYRWFDSQELTPEFAFGSGLSYTNFEYSNIRLSNTNAMVGDLVEVSFDLKNTGKIAGEEVSQLYLSSGQIIPNLLMPEKQLRGFKKVLLNPGETKTVTFTLSPEEFYVYNVETKSYLVPEGNFIARIGGSSDLLPLQTEFKLNKAEGKADLSVKNIRTMPAFPKEGEEVIFMASVINNGTMATKKGDNHKILFFVDGKEVASYFSKVSSIPVGGMDFVCASGQRGKNWVASKGEFRITATIEVSESKDLNPDNNSCEAELTIPNGPVEIAGIIK
jgi:beta-glucosidase